MMQFQLFEEIYYCFSSKSLYGINKPLFFDSPQSDVALRVPYCVGCFFECFLVLKCLPKWFPKLNLNEVDGALEFFYERVYHIK